MPTPKDMPARKRIQRVSMAARHAHCQDKAKCHGPGCKAITGKTRSDAMPLSARLAARDKAAGKRMTDPA